MTLADIRQRIERAGGDPSTITIVAVTKGHPVATARRALESGLTVLAENRVQEALPKLAELPDAEWHLIGHLQTNKVRQVAGRFALIQSIDSVRLAETLAARGPQPVLLEVNAAREPAKHGFAPEELGAAAARIGALLEVRGLMGMGPAAGDPKPAFELLRRLRDEVEQRLGRPMPVLSMGMSGDFEAAVAAGSSMLRLGRALFGPRDL